MKVAGIDKFVGCEDLIVTVECAECGASHRMWVPADAWKREHLMGCPLYDRTAYLDEWAFSLHCPTCGAKDDDDSRIAVCDCERVADRNIISGHASDAFVLLQDRNFGGMSGWVLSGGELAINVDNKFSASITVNEDAERNGRMYPELVLDVFRHSKGGGYKLLYSASVELPLDAELPAYRDAVAKLKARAGEVFDGRKPQFKYEEL